MLLSPIIIPSNIVLAADCPTKCVPGDPFCYENPLKACSFEDLIGRIINFIFAVSLVLTPLMIIIAGFYFITAAGNPEKIKTAKDIILYTIIGLVIVLLSKGLVDVIKDVFKV